jgi:hypothetical protein
MQKAKCKRAKMQRANGKMQNGKMQNVRNVKLIKAHFLKTPKELNMNRKKVEKSPNSEGVEHK